jgi:hypothetical protein
LERKKRRKAWFIQQLLPYCTDNEDKDTLRNSDLL